jgi:hypothetical protein
MRKCVQNLPSDKETKKPMQTIKSKTRRDDKKMNRHPKNKTTREHEIMLFAHSVDPGPLQPHQRLRKKQANGVPDDPCRTRSEISL